MIQTSISSVATEPAHINGQLQSRYKVQLTVIIQFLYFHLSRHQQSWTCSDDLPHAPRGQRPPGPGAAFFFRVLSVSQPPQKHFRARPLLGPYRDDDPANMAENATERKSLLASSSKVAGTSRRLMSIANTIPPPWATAAGATHQTTRRITHQPSQTLPNGRTNIVVEWI